jgi:hypothetical protein
MNSSQTLENKLNGLTGKLNAKNALAQNYKKLVKESLGRIQTKIAEILKNQQDKILRITQETDSNLEKTRQELQAQQEQIKKEGADALQRAEQDKTTLQTNLNDTQNSVQQLQAQLNAPNPDTQNMQVIVDKLRNDLTSAQQAQTASLSQIELLKAKLAQYDELRDKTDALVQRVISKIDEIFAQIDQMSINQADIDELISLLSKTEKALGSSGSNSGSGDSGFFGDLFKEPEPLVPESGPDGRVGLNRGSSSKQPPIKLPPIKLPPAAGKGPPTGGKTKRRRHNKGKKYKSLKGGYVMEKKSSSKSKKRRNKKTRKGKRKTDTSSSSSSKRSSKSSRSP